MNIGKLEKSVTWLLKVVIPLATAIAGFVVFDDWYSKRTDLEIYPTNIWIDSTGVELGKFELEVDEKRTVNDLKLLDGNKYLTAFAILHAQVMLGGSAESLKKYYLQGFAVAEALLNDDRIQDSVFLAQSSGVSDAVRDSVRTHEKTMERLSTEVRKIRDNHMEEVKDRVRIAISLAVENSSAAQTALLEPALLRVVFEDRAIEARLVLSGSGQEMSFLGLKMNMGKATMIIPGASLKELTFKTETKEDMGSAEWADLMTALAQPQATGLLRYFTIDGTYIESKEFSFSEDYHDRYVTDRFKSLKSP